MVQNDHENLIFLVTFQQKLFRVPAMVQNDHEILISLVTFQQRVCQILERVQINHKTWFFQTK
jgi:hypothetical protein